MRAIVTQRETLGNHGGLVDSLEREYIVFLEGMGFNVFPISNYVSDVTSLFNAINADLVVLTGGGIVQAEVYRYEVPGWHQLERDAMEDTLIDITLRSGVPLLGICRGMHKANAFFGGRVSGFAELKTLRMTGETHSAGRNGEMFFNVNHYHNDGLYVQDLGEGIEPVLFDMDNGSVEAIRHADYKLLGVQWHPERMAENDAARLWVESIVENWQNCS